MNKLGQRVVTAGVLIAVLLLVLFVLPSFAATLVVSAVVLVGAWEWSAFVSRAEKLRLVYVVAIAFGIFAADWLVTGSVELRLVLLAALTWWFAAFLWILRYPTPVPPALAAVAGAFVLIPAWVAIRATLGVPGRGAELLLFLLSVVWAADIGAYFAGHWFGRLKLAPSVSPGKTWEGLLGGLALAAVAAVAGGWILDLPVMVMVPLGLGIASISVVGDLTESLFKRSVGAKDSGRLFPGHGGALDRIDSLTSAAPLFALALQWLAVLP